MFDISLELPCGPENWPSVPLAIAFSQLLDVWKITPNSLLLYQTNGSYSGWCHLEHACHHFCFSCADSPRHNGMTYTLWLYSGAHCTQKQYTLTRNCTWTFEFGSGPELALFSMVLSQNAGQWAAAPGAATRSWGQPPIQSQPFCPQTTTLALTFNTVFSKLYEVVNTSV